CISKNSNSSKFQQCIPSFDFFGCRGMASLEIKCPYLEQVHLDGCDHIDRASFCLVGLQLIVNVPNWRHLTLQLL
ncbi:hypothetical protein MKW98_010061, partial [Papaver atlanticum]